MITGKAYPEDEAVITTLIDAEGPFIVDAEHWYQPIAYRWALNLGDQQADEIERFIGYYKEAAGSSAVVLAGAKKIVE